MRIRPPVAPILLSLVTLLALSANADTRYYSLILNGKKAGYVRVQEEPQGAGEKVTTDCLIKVTVLGAPFDMRYQAISTYSKVGAPLPDRYTVSMDAGPRRITSDSRFAGRKVEIDYSANGAKDHKSLTLPDRTFLVEGNLPETWERVFHGLGPISQPTKIQVFSPTTATVTPMTFRPGAGGTIIAEESGVPVNFTLQKDTGVVTLMDVPSQIAQFKLADKTALEGIEGVEAASRAFAVSNVAFDNPLGLEFITLELKTTVAGEKITAATLQLPRQTFAGTVKENTATGRMTIHRVKYSGKDAAPLPLSPALKKQFAAYLKSDTMVECDDPEIKKLAASLTKGTTNSWDATKKIGNWVHNNIAYKITGVGARQCLKEKAGDCGPHSWLSIALLRAAGIPAKITGGALYSELLGGSFGQHYWTEVWLGEKAGWFPIDTTSGEIGSLSPIHLNLWRNAGGIASLSVNVIDYSPKPAAAAANDKPATSRHAMNLRPNETWSYTFLEAGKQIGKETARVARIRPDGDAEIEYNIDLELQATKVACSGMFVVKPDCSPTSLSLKIVQAGLTQTVEAKAEGKKANLVIEAAGIKNNRSADLPAGACFEMQLSAMTWDLLFRTLTLEIGKSVEVPVYMVDQLHMEKIKFQVTKEETIKIGGQDIACLVVKLGAGEKMYVEKGTNRLVRAETGEGKLVVERVPDSK